MLAGDGAWRPHRVDRVLEVVAGTRTPLGVHLERVTRQRQREGAGRTAVEPLESASNDLMLSACDENVVAARRAGLAPRPFP